MAYWLYNFVLSLLFIALLPAMPLLLLWGERFRKGFLQRLGFYPRAVVQRVAGARPVWIHAVSVGEVLSLRRLAGEIRKRYPGRKILLSTFTATGNQIARQSGVGDAVIFFPLDHPWIVCRALAIFDPSVVVILETEIWPNFLRLAHARGIPTLLVSGRISPSAFRWYRLLRFAFAPVVRCFSVAGMQTEDNARRIAALGLDSGRILVTGSLKHTAGDTGDGAECLRGPSLPIEKVNGRPVLVAGSTHRGEEEVLLDVFLFLKSSFPELLMVLAPRHPQRFEEVERLLQQKNVAYEMKSRMNGRSGGRADVIVLDTIGELPAFYSLADVAFIGGSLVDAGGHNPIEAARLQKPVLFGPYMTNCAAVASEIKQKGGGVEVRGREDLIREISALLADPKKAQSMGRNAYRVVQGDGGVMERTIALLSRYLHP